jgi:hypothetical protein
LTRWLGLADKPEIISRRADLRHYFRLADNSLGTWHSLRPELEILGMVLLRIANVFHIESKRIGQRRELFAAQDDRGRIIVERAAARKLLHLGQYRMC